MLLVDTSVWIDHFRKGDNTLAEALENDAVIMRPHIHGELALGSLKDRTAVFSLLRNLPEVVVTTGHSTLPILFLVRLRTPKEHFGASLKHPSQVYISQS